MYAVAQAYVRHVFNSEQAGGLIASPVQVSIPLKGLSSRTSRDKSVLTLASHFLHVFGWSAAEYSINPVSRTWIDRRLVRSDLFTIYFQSFLLRL